MNNTQALLVHAAEEAVEFAQAATKRIRGDWGLKNLTDEAADIAAFLIVLKDLGLIDAERFANRRAEKVIKMRRKYGGK
jgi:NTP pyrophosphatase (non-canonical NTP hydrolase)